MSSLTDALDGFHVPARVARAVEAADTTKPAMQAVQRFMGIDSFLLVLAGLPGRGKTVAGGYALSLNRDPPRVLGLTRSDPTAPGGIIDYDETIPGNWRLGRFTKAIDLTRAGTYDKDFWRKLERPHLLVIDEIGFELADKSGYAIGNLLNLLVAREAEDRKTILTTNMPKASFDDAYLTGAGERIRSRIRGQGGSYFCSVVGPDLRAGAMPSTEAA